MSGVHITLKKVAASCCFPSVNLTFSHCQLARKNHSNNIMFKPKLHSILKKSGFVTPAMQIIKQNHNMHTTFADLQPIEVEHISLNEISFLLSEHSYQASKMTTWCDTTRNVHSQLIPATNTFWYPFSYDIAAMANSRLKTPPFILTFAGKRYYSTKNNSSFESKNEDEKNLPPESSVPESKTQQLKRIFAVYGTFGFVFHIVISLASLGIMYLLVSSGIDVVGLLKKMGIELSSVAGGASTMVVAYALHKLILPLRASITIVSVPMLVRYLRRAGYLKK